MRDGRSKLLIALGVLLVTALPVQAEIYKWVDKDGTVKYTDTPPPAGAKSLSTIKKKATSPAVIPAPAAATPEGGLTNPTLAQPAGGDGAASEQEMAKKKREIDEIEKKNKAEKEAQAKQKQLNCSAAKANYQSYSQGGRVYRMNEKGEREYLDDKGLSDGAAKAKRDMQEYCS
ncbi:hypothetical protein Meth11DRAFT_0916 [Methylophilaceae bacterium 11]|uniref:DUF4124 domain-containing protein n=1 Tax=Methylotenera sp. N17 TaxID=1502761 RepID=UPI000445D5A0|nr:DUF4124 domain-containing protein [Methylotenera sp. N17]EUJ10105.1 hypothetical protein Meth11DRAFT_0916 [Methylophilaceae bacterium 11]